MVLAGRTFCWTKYLLPSCRTPSHVECGMIAVNLIMFLAQVDAACRVLFTRVVECKRMEKEGHYEVILEESPLFPEGGGQPSDTGYIGSSRVVHVRRSEDGKCIHVCESQVTEGMEVVVKVDNDRRDDHMQQHTGQHLLSAILENEFHLKTSSWSLGVEECFVELEASYPNNTAMDILADTSVMGKIESKVNQIIREAKPVVVHLDTPEQAKERLTRGRISDVALSSVSHVSDATIRLIEIVDVDINPCCGTHVANTSQLQCIKLLGTSKARGKNVRIHFIMGNRVLQRLQHALNIEKQLTATLSCGPNEFNDKIIQLRSQWKQAERREKLLRDEWLPGYARELWMNQQKVVWREHADLEFIHSIAKAWIEAKPEENQQERAIILVGGCASTGGPVLVVGTGNYAVSEAVKYIQARIGMDNMKGGGKGLRWQGKATRWESALK